jgi:tetratricopeptide (TPR) repeat protein
MGELLDGLVTGLPVGARAQIVERADGIPLYTIETVRGLLDKGVLEKGDDGSLRLVAELGELEVPPGLTALIGSRLDALEPDERRLVKECSVLGGSFPREAIEAISDVDATQIEGLLSSLVRKEVLAVRADKLSPERGQYAFTQSLIRSVAYDMLTKAERRTRHLRTAEHLQSAFPDEGAEVAEVIAAHLYDAYTAASDGADAEELRARACRAYVLAAERAGTVGALEGAESAYLKAVELSSDEAEQASFKESAGRTAWRAGWNDRALELLEAAAGEHATAGRLVDAARATGWVGQALSSLGKGELAIARIREALASLEGTTAPPDVVAELHSALAVILVFAGHREEATESLEAALTLSQHHQLAETLANSLDTKGTLLSMAGRNDEALAMYALSIDVARRHGITQAELRSEPNLADLCMTRDLPAAEEHARAALGLARRWGGRGIESLAVANLMYVLIETGRFDEALQLGNELFEAADDEVPGAEVVRFRLAHLEALRGNVDVARQHLSKCGPESDDVQYKASYAAAQAAVALAGGDGRQALEVARAAIHAALEGGMGLAHEAARYCFPVTIDAALATGEIEEAERMAEMMASRPAGEVPPFLHAHTSRAKALVAGARGDAKDMEEKIVAAEAAFSELGYPYWAARTQLDRAEWLARVDRPDEAATLAHAAAAVFEEMGAAPMVARAQELFEAEVSQSRH